MWKKYLTPTCADWAQVVLPPEVRGAESKEGSLLSGLLCGVLRSTSVNVVLVLWNTMLVLLNFSPSLPGDEIKWGLKQIS